MAKARGFGTTVGIGTTDLVLTSHVGDTTTTSYSVWSFLRGEGGSNTGRIWDAFLSLAPQNILFNRGDLGTNLYEFQRSWSGASAAWRFTRPSTQAWHNIVVTYDYSSTTNDPVIYVDGTAVAITEISAPSGTISVLAEPFAIGNRDSDNARGWDGHIAEWAIWNRILTPQEAMMLGSRKSPLWMPVGLQTYLRDGLTTEWKNGLARKNTTTLTGTKPTEELNIVDPPWLRRKNL